MISKVLSKHNRNKYCYLYEGILPVNLHEECLLKYLLNTTDLFKSTELLKFNNSLIEKGLFGTVILAKNRKINYTANRI